LHFATASVGSLSLAFALFVAGADFVAGALFAAAGFSIAGALFAAAADLLVAAVAVGAGVALAELVAGAAPFFEAALSTPPCPEHAPLPDVAEVVPSLQRLVPCALRRPLVIPSAITASAVERSRVRMSAPERGYASEDPAIARLDTLDSGEAAAVPVS